MSSVPSVVNLSSVNLPSVNLSSELRNELKSVETEIKYEGYLLQQQRAMERLKKSEQHSIPEWFDYHSVSGLSREMQEKLTHVRPRTIGQASRIPGVTPAAVSLVNVSLKSRPAAAIRPPLCKTVLARHKKCHSDRSLPNGKRSGGICFSVPTASSVWFAILPPA